MYFVKILILLLIAGSLNIFAQENRYWGELKGFELYKKGNWKSLRPFVSTKEDVINIFSQDCSNGCNYDENWRFQIIYVGQCSSYSESKKGWVPRVADEMLNKYSNILFYPKKRIKKGDLKFGKHYVKFEQVTTHIIPSNKIYYTNELGLIYTFSNEDTYNKQYRKGDLVSIGYSWTDSEYEKYKHLIDCETNALLYKQK